MRRLPLALFLLLTLTGCTCRWGTRPAPPPAEPIWVVERCQWGTLDGLSAAGTAP